MPNPQGPAARGRRNLRSVTARPPRRPRVRPATRIDLEAFRMIFQIPLIAESDTAITAPGAPWEPVRDPLKALDGPPPDKGATDETRTLHAARTGSRALEEQVYFHDFAQRFLYAGGDSAPMKLYRRTDIDRLEADFSDNDSATGIRTHTFDVARHHLNLFPGARIAIVSVELDWTGPGTLTLAAAQTVIDHLRRSYVPFWSEFSGDLWTGGPKDGHPIHVPGRVPRAVRLFGADDKVVIGPDDPAAIAAPPDRPPPEAAIKAMSDAEREALAKNLSNSRRAATRRMAEDARAFLAQDHIRGRRDPAVFAHWRTLCAPFLAAPGWRDPSDERLPVLSYISLKKNRATERDTLRQISHGDWIRLADAEEAGTDPMPYNPDFLAPLEKLYFYDRFFPHAAIAPYYGVRHLFGGAHYATVGTGDFFDNALRNHFRRHYAQLALVARFEYTALLAFSSWLTEIVRRRDEAIQARDGTAERYFEDRLHKLHGSFLSFTHRFRFTGISSQIQAGEMFQKFRDSLDLDTLYGDVKAELESAISFVHSRTQDREARAATRLTQIATLGLPAGLALAGVAVTTMPFWDLPETARLFGISAIAYGATHALLEWVRGRGLLTRAKNWFEAGPAPANTDTDDERRLSAGLRLAVAVSLLLAFIGWFVEPLLARKAPRCTVQSSLDNRAGAGHDCVLPGRDARAGRQKERRFGEIARGKLSTR